MAIVTTEEAKSSNVQHKKPCHDCPWRKKSVRGWLGGLKAREWTDIAHGEGGADCHAYKGDPQPQCVGLAMYRANVLKLPRDPNALRANKSDEVFATPGDFIDHHEGRSEDDEEG